jgi:hypothetical protein
VTNWRVPKVRPCSRPKLELLGANILLNHYPDCWNNPGPLPVEDLFERFLPEEYGVESFIEADLPPNIEGYATPIGDTGGPEIAISSYVYDKLEENDGRARFTTVHEIAHGILHVRQLQHALYDKAGTMLFRRTEIPRYLDPEWQATVLAASLLMPTEAVKAIVDRYGADPAALSETFMVSFRAAQLRLHFMGLEDLTTPRLVRRAS